MAAVVVVGSFVGWMALRDVAGRIADSRAASDSSVAYAGTIGPAFTIGPNLGDLRDLAVYADVAAIDDPLTPQIERSATSGKPAAPKPQEQQVATPDRQMPDLSQWRQEREARRERRMREIDRPCFPFCD